jgi:hypothetical protein
MYTGTYTAEDKWDVFVQGPSGLKLEVTGTNASY